MPSVKPPQWPMQERYQPHPLLLKVAVGLGAGVLGMTLGDIYASSFPFHVHEYLGPLYFDNLSIGTFGGLALGGLTGYKGAELGIRIAGSKKRR